MTSKKEIVAKLCAAVYALLKDADAFGPTEEHTARVVDAVRVVLEDGLEGNRSIRPFIWCVVRRVGRAYPITFHSSIDKVRALGRQDGLDREQLEDAWIKQALHEGVLSSLLTDIIHQFQIRSAYLSEAVISDKVLRMELIAAVDRLKDVIQAVPDAPSVSSWSSDDSFVHTPRSSEAEHRVESSGNHLCGRSLGDARSSSKRWGGDRHIRSSAKSDRQGKTVVHQTKQSNQVSDLEQGMRLASIGSKITTPLPDTLSAAKGNDSDDGFEISTPERSSFFGRTTRNLSGTLYHSIASDPAIKDSPMSELSQEEQASRFWSRPRSLGTASSLKREVEKDIGACLSTPVTADERSKASQLLMKEINKIGRSVLKQFCSGGQPLRADLYPVSKILHLYEEAFCIGLRPYPQFRPNVPDIYLSDFEKIVPRGNATPQSLLIAMKTIYPQTLSAVAAMSDGSDAFQQWLKEALMKGRLGDQMETVLEHQEFLRGWYRPEGIVTNEDLLQELIATCRGLDVISISGARKEEIPSTVDHSCNPSEEKNDQSAETEGEDDKEVDGVQQREVCVGNDDVRGSCMAMEMGGDKWKHSIDDPEICPKTDSDQATDENCSKPFNDVKERRSPSGQLQMETSISGSVDFGRSPSSSQELTSYQQLTLSASNSGRLRSGLPSRSLSKGHRPSSSVMSACFSGEDEGDWRGVWKDVDVVRYELRTNHQGDHYVVYIIEVVANDGTHWQTARRFSDLIALNKALIKQQVNAPHSWTNLGRARVVSGKRRFSREIVEARLVMIRQCLWDLMKTFPESLIWISVAQFLDAPLSLLRATKSRQRSEVVTDDRIRDAIADRIANHLSSMALIVDLPVNVSNEVLFEMQKGLCAGCQVYLPFVSQQRSLFSHSGCPRKCAYTELLYCHNCHKMDSAILPSRVLHCWDFAKYPVSVNAKAHLYSIFPSPVLCINAVNPGLLAAVPVLARLDYLRQNIFRNMEQLRERGMEGKRIALSIEENAGCNKHLLQNCEFWSLKDLGDISRGIFARVPRWLEAVNKDIEAVVSMHSM